MYISDTLCEYRVIKVANLDTSDAGFSSSSEEELVGPSMLPGNLSRVNGEQQSQDDKACSVNPVDKFSVRPKIRNIYDQVLSNLPAIEDTPSVSYAILVFTEFPDLMFKMKQQFSLRWCLKC